MRRYRWLWGLFALIVLGVLGWMAFRREPAVITLEDGATICVTLRAAWNEVRFFLQQQRGVANTE